ncbi:hypothetical protein JTE90_003427 [Oedothorax gibbosus]|uniref:Uncharacterized protein n=1 Tax=Oedothorax gibbosus TaxID=931172 RepID=A0AAV6TZY6_9ARAC|nr:hypothetical protein JTE90_003427 [Oedothorax gibbosus]
MGPIDPTSHTGEAMLCVKSSPDFCFCYREADEIEQNFMYSFAHVSQIYRNGRLGHFQKVLICNHVLKRSTSKKPQYG